MIRIITVGLFLISMASCTSTKEEKSTEEAATVTGIKIIGSMKNVMWEGKLGSNIDLDTISNKVGLYGLGPQNYLTGEVLINNGKSYLSQVNADSTMKVEKRFDLSAPFFVYANVSEWTEEVIPPTVNSIEDVEAFIDEKTKSLKRPFAFKLIGKVTTASIHIQNLPRGTKVSSPDEAHQGQVNFDLKNEDALIIGFFSTEHAGVFTHHGSFLHMHLISADERKMGHLDKLEIDKMKLYLPK